MTAPDLDRRLAALARAAEIADGRLDTAVARRVVERAGRRAGLGLETTVAALAGPTGAGKSSLFNALAGGELAATSVRRPTTGATAAAVWGDVAPALLDWLGARTRHVVDRAGAPVVLLDLPDHDSVREEHRAEMERVLALADLLVWVVDPQKYADAALHDRYLRPLATHGDVMAVVLNQADRLDADGLAACRADLGRLLAEDGLPGLPVLAVSARSGAGLPDLRALLRDRAEARAAAAARLRADVVAAAGGLRAGCDGRAAAGRREDREALVAALADAAGVPAVVGAVAASHRREGVLAAGWPFARWVRRFRPDPLRRLRVDPAGRSSLPPATPVQRSQVASAIRTLAARAADGLPDPWPPLVRAAATRAEDALPDRLDRAVTGAAPAARRPRWWLVAALLQRLLAAAAAAGALWLVALAALGFLHLSDAVPLPRAAGVPVPTLLVAGGLLAGVVLAGVARWVNGHGAARRARRAQRRLRAAIEEVAAEAVLEPVRAELAAREELCRALAEAADGTRGR